VKFFQRRVGRTRGHDWKLFKKQVRLDAGKFSFGNRVCDEWNRLSSWVVNQDSVNNFRGNLNHYLRDNRGFKKVMTTLSLLEPFALSCKLIVMVLGKLGKQCTILGLFAFHACSGTKRVFLHWVMT